MSTQLNPQIRRLVDQDICGTPAVLRHLGWTTGRVTVTVDPASGTLTITPGGMQVVTARGMVRLPVAVRRACEIGTGDRLLLVVGPGRGALSAFTSYAVQRWIEIGHEKQAVGVR